MKVLVKESVAWGRLSLGKGMHNLPPAIAEALIRAGVAVSRSSVVKVEGENLRLEIAPDEKRTIIIKNVVNTDNRGADDKRRVANGGKGAHKGRSHK